MTAECVVAVIEIERVRRGSVDERRIERAGACVRAEHETRTRAREYACHDGCRWIAASGQSDADGVEDSDFGPLYCFRRQIIVTQCVDALRKLECEGHFNSCRNARWLCHASASAHVRDPLAPFHASHLMWCPNCWHAVSPRDLIRDDTFGRS